MPIICTDDTRKHPVQLHPVLLLTLLLSAQARFACKNNSNYLNISVCLRVISFDASRTCSFDGQTRVICLGGKQLVAKLRDVRVACHKMIDVSKFAE
jgi:hypothetical protein